MNGEFVKEFERLSQKNIEIGQKHYSPNRMFEVGEKPEVLKFQIATLTGLVNYIKSEIDMDVVGKKIVVIFSPTSVEVADQLDAETHRRNFPLCARLAAEMTISDWRVWRDVEEFIIFLKSRFVPTDGQAKLLNYVSRLAKTDSLQFEDDGVTQTATVKKGMLGALKAQEAAPSIIELKPFRTFREVDQPASNFLFRMSSQGDDAPACSLHEADGGTWRLKAVENIKNYLAEKLPGTTVIG